jgi:hypothetical protein
MSSKHRTLLSHICGRIRTFNEEADLKTRSGSYLCVVALFSLVACSAGDSHNVEDSLSSAAPIVVQAATSTADSGMVTVSTSPGAVCAAHPAGDNDPSKELHLYGDWQGLTRFFVVRPPASENGAISLDCQVDGKLVTYPIDLHSPTLFQPASSTARSASLPVRPALKGDPMLPTQEALRSAGYPLRPDPSRAPDLYARWLAAVSKETTVVPANLVADPNPKHVHGNGTTSTTYDTPWAGLELNARVTYVATIAEWFMPSAVSSNTNFQEANLWTGLDGDSSVGGSSAVIQGGVEIDTVSWDALSYSPWVEYFNLTPEYYSGVGPNANDEILFTVYAGNAAGNVDASGGYGWFEYEDVTQSVTSKAAVAAPALNQGGVNFQFNGATAEYVLEAGNTVQAGGGYEQLYQLSDYGSTEMSGIAMDTTETWHDFASDPVVTDQLYGMTTATMLSADVVGFTWVGPGSSCAFGGGC